MPDPADRTEAGVDASHRNPPLPGQHPEQVT